MSPDEIGSLIGSHTGRSCQSKRIPDQIVCYRYATYQRLQFENFLAVENLKHLGICSSRGALHDFKLFFSTGVIDSDVEHESVQLRLGKRVGSLLLDGILGCQNKERWVQRVAVSTDGDLFLLHRFQQSCLSLGRCPVDLVSQHHICEDGTGNESKDSITACGIGLDHFCACDVTGHQIRRELNPVEGE